MMKMARGYFCSKVESLNRTGTSALSCQKCRQGVLCATACVYTFVPPLPAACLVRRHRAGARRHASKLRQMPQPALPAFGAQAGHQRLDILPGLKARGF